jgi:hypothetical protein
MNNKKRDKAKIAEYNFYTSVYAYIRSEYKPKYGRIYADSTISDKIANLVSQYYWGGNSVPFVAGQVVDLIKSKYKC